MIFERFTFIIIYLALSGLKPGYGLEAKPSHSSPHLLQNTALLDRYVVHDPGKYNFQQPKIFTQVPLQQQQLVSQVSEIKPELREIAKSSSEISQENSSSLKEPAKISRRWSLGGMVLTASMALFLIWILFKKPPHKSETVMEKLSQDRESAVKPIKPETEPSAKLVTKSDSVEKDLSLQGTLEKSDLDLAHNSQDVPDSTAPKKISQSSFAIANLDVVNELIKDLQDSSSSSNKVSLRRKAIWQLTQVGDYRSVEPLLKIMPQVGELDKGLILEAVNQISRRSFQPINDQLFAALQDKNPEVRLNALRDLESLYQFVSPFITKIAQMQSDTDYEVRQTATQVLQQLNANPLPTFNSKAEDQVDNLVAGGESEANLHLVAYLLAELDTEG